MGEEVMTTTSFNRKVTVERGKSALAEKKKERRSFLFRGPADPGRKKGGPCRLLERDLSFSNRD